MTVEWTDNFAGHKGTIEVPKNADRNTIIAEVRRDHSQTFPECKFGNPLPVLTDREIVVPAAADNQV